MASPDDLTGPINLGNPCELNIIELAQTILELTGSCSPVIQKPLPQEDPKQRQPDISLAKLHLGWDAKIPLHEGLRKTIIFFDELLRKQ